MKTGRSAEIFAQPISACNRKELMAPGDPPYWQTRTRRMTVLPVWSSMRMRLVMQFCW